MDSRAPATQWGVAAWARPPSGERPSGASRAILGTFVRGANVENRASQAWPVMGLVDGGAVRMGVVCACPAQSSTDIVGACTGYTQVVRDARTRQVSASAAWGDAPILTIHSMKMMMR